jgi:hypothetical protein
MIAGLNYKMEEISVESSESLVVDMGFIITLCPIPSVLLGRSHIRSEVALLGIAPRPICHCRGGAG